MRSPLPLSAVLGLFLAFDSNSHAAILAGNLNIVQNDVGNAGTSVTGSFGYSQGDISYVSGNRGDFTLRFGGATAADDLAGGILIVSIAENGRSNEGPISGATPAISAGPGYATPSIQPLGGGYGSATFIGPTARTGTSAGGEWNVNQGVGYFKYSEFIGGWITNAVNNDPMSSLPSATFGLTVGSGADNSAGYHVFDSTANAGTYNVNLSSFTAPGSGLAATSQNGIMIVVGGKNEANHALSRANADGTFDINVRSSDSGNSENDGAGFVYIPTGQEGVAAMGRVDGLGNVEAGSGIGVVTKGGTGEWLITTTGLDPSNSTLLLSPEAGGNNGDNIYSYEYDYERQVWVVQGRDLQTATVDPLLQNVNADKAFSYALISNVTVPEPSTALLGLGSLSLLFLRRRK